jgi:choline oxidase
MSTFDYVIAGGGTAGCVLAARLAEDPDVTVCLIEAGPAYEHDPNVIEFRGAVALVGTDYDFDYPIAEQARGNSSINLSVARMLGGCSSHNDAVAWRALDRDLERWVAAGAEGWDPESCRPFFERVFEKVGIVPAGRGSAGARAVHAAAIELGIPEVETNRDDFDQGAAWYELNARDGIRRSAAVSYLYPLADLPANLTLVTETTVDRVVLDDRGRAVGVEAGSSVIEARREVVIAAGAINSPKILLQSGIGPADHLEDVGIDLRHDLPGVGAGLTDHCETFIMWALNRPVGESLNNCENGIFASTGIQGPEFDLYLHVITQFYYVDPATLGFPISEPASALTLTPNTARPRSAGTLRLRSDDPRATPLIDPGYLTDPDAIDERVLVEGIKLGRRLAQQPSLKPWIDEELAPGYRVQSDEEIAAFVRRTHNTVYHPAASCRIGPETDPMSVLDPQLRVRGLEGLRVADASVFPEMPSNNIAMTIMMIGERCAAAMLGEDRATARAASG